MEGEKVLGKLHELSLARGQLLVSLLTKVSSRTSIAGGASLLLAVRENTSGCVIHPVAI